MPPRQLMHNYDIKDKNGVTLNYYLKIYNLPVP